MSTSTQYPFTNSANHPLPNSIFFMLVAKTTAPSMLAPHPATPELVATANQTVQTVIQIVVNHYAKVKSSHLKTHPTATLPASLVNCPIANACLNFLNAKIASYLSRR